jgi:hypothetical protein
MIVFKRVPGQAHVARKEYALQDGSQGSVVDSSNWEQNVRPGAAVTMSVLLRLSAAHKTTAQTCPNCGVINNPDNKDQKLLQW